MSSEPEKKSLAKAVWILLAVTWLLFLVPIPGLGIVGMVLNFVAFVVAIVVITRGETTKGIVQIVCTIIVSPVIYMIGLAILGGTVAAAHKEGMASAAREKTQQVATRTNEAPTVEIYKTTARELYNSYEANEVATDDMLRGKIIEVSGRVESIEKDFADDIIVSLKINNEFAFARFNIDQSQKSVAAGLSKNQQVTIQCREMRRLLTFPSGTDCVIL